MTSETLWSKYNRAYPSGLSNGKMTELSFAKSFLSTLDSRPLKLQPDYAIDPKNPEITAPYTLPRMPNAFKKSSESSQVDTDAQKPSTLNVTLKSSKNPVMSLSLPDTDLGTSVLGLKERVAKELGIEGTDKIRVLFKRKPVGDVKTVKEVVGEEDVGREVEFGVMVMGYKEAATKGDTEMKDAEVEVPVAQGPSGEEVLAQGEFWNDLKGFLVLRLRDEGKANEVFEAFRGSWNKSGG
jgi:hypothetical protein